MFRDADIVAHEAADFALVVGVVAHPRWGRGHPVFARDLGQKRVLTVGRGDQITANGLKAVLADNPGLSRRGPCG